MIKKLEGEAAKYWGHQSSFEGAWAFLPCLLQIWKLSKKIIIGLGLAQSDKSS